MLPLATSRFRDAGLQTDSGRSVLEGQRPAPNLLPQHRKRPVTGLAYDGSLGHTGGPPTTLPNQNAAVAGDIRAVKTGGRSAAFNYDQSNGFCPSAAGRGGTVPVARPKQRTACCPADPRARGHSSSGQKLHAKESGRFADPERAQFAVAKPSILSPVVVAGQVDVLPLQR